MTFVIPAWLDSILRILWIVFLIILYSYTVTKVLEIFRIKENQWFIGAVVFLALIGTQYILENQYRVLYPQEHDIVIKGNGEIVENALNRRLITTDKDLFVFIGDRKPFQDTMSYSFYTKDGQIQDVEILICFHETDVETIMKTFQLFKEVVEPYDRSQINYEVVEEKFIDEVSQQIGNFKKEELMKDMMIEIIETFESQAMNEHEKKLFSIDLN